MPSRWSSGSAVHVELRKIHPWKPRISSLLHTRLYIIYIYHISYWIIWIIYQFVCVSSWDKASCSNSLMSLHSWSLWTLWSFVQKIATWRMQISIRWAASNSQALEVSQASWRRRNSATLSVSASQSVGPCKRKWEPRNMPSNLSVTSHHHANHLAMENCHWIWNEILLILLCTKSWYYVFWCANCKSSALPSPVLTCRDTELQEFGAQSLIFLALLGIRALDTLRLSLETWSVKANVAA